jgi:hypothetical protein
MTLRELNLTERGHACVLTGWVAKCKLETFVGENRHARLDSYLLYGDPAQQLHRPAYNYRRRHAVCGVPNQVDYVEIYDYSAASGRCKESKLS